MIHRLLRNITGANPKRIIVDTNRKLPLSLKIFNDNKSDNLILCSEDNFGESNKTCEHMLLRLKIIY